jgi:hypothetical protein
MDLLMPSHTHLNWEVCEMNGKEMPHASFNKWKKRRFLEDLRLTGKNVLERFTENLRT